jgi:hypothetical protein
MSKFLRNLLLQISKALVNSKIQFLIQKLFFLAFGLVNLAARSASGPSSPRVGRVFVGNMFSLSDHAFPSRPPLPRLSVNRAPTVRFTPFPAPADPSRKSLAPLPHASDDPELL